MNGRRNVAPVTGVKIKAVSLGFAENGIWLSNADIYEASKGKEWREKLLDKGHDPDYLEDVLGLSMRYWSRDPRSGQFIDGTNAEDLMVEAGRKVLDKAGVNRDSIDFLITISTTSPRYINSLGPSVAKRLNLSCPAIEFKTGCASVCFALVQAAQSIKAGWQNVLIIAGETPSRVVEPGSNLYFSVGDGAGAILVEKSERSQAGLQYAFLGTDSKWSGSMGSKGLLPPNKQDMDAGNYKMLINRESGDAVLQLWQTVSEELGTRIDQMEAKSKACCIHQVNKKIYELTVKSSGIRQELCPWVLPKYGNCGSVGIITAMAHSGELLSIDNTTMMAAVGGGISYGGLIWTN